MSDYIKREDAINAVADQMAFEASMETGNDYMGADYSDDAKEWLSGCPSADRPKEWIPCSERLPEERQDVYVTVFWDNYGDTVTAYGRRTQFGWSLWNTVEGELLKGYTVTAWMPLPEPWKGADDE